MERAEEMMVQVDVMKEKESALDKQFSCFAQAVEFLAQSEHGHLKRTDCELILSDV